MKGKSMNLEVLEESPLSVKVTDGNYEFWLPREEFQRRTQPEVKHSRRKLSSKMEAVLEYMQDNQWHTIKQISEAVSYGPAESGLTAGIRALRKPEFGSHNIEKRYIGESLYEYRLVN
jgi:hypothetical protein